MNLFPRRLLKTGFLFFYILLSVYFVVTGELINLGIVYCLSILYFMVFLMGSIYISRWGYHRAGDPTYKKYNAFEAGVRSKEELAIFKLKYPNKEVSLPENFKCWLLKLDIYVYEMMVDEKFISIRDKEVE